MRPFPTNPTLSEFQAYVSEMEAERGFTEETPAQKCLVLTEEVGELCKEIRKLEGVKMADNYREGNVANEIADVLLVLTTLANRLNVDLATALATKETKNNARTWKKAV